VIAAARLAALVSAVAMLAACGAESLSGAESNTGDRASNAPPIASVWRSRCGACHVRVEPRTHSREQLEKALARHRKRVRLREDQWQELVTFLASNP